MTHGRKRRPLPVMIACLLAALLLLAWFLARDLTLTQVVAGEDRLRGWIGQHQLLAFCLAIPLFTLLSLVPATGGKTLICGWLFGLGMGTAVANLGQTAAALISFFVSRHLLRDAVQTRWGTQIARLDQALARHGPLYLLAMRVVHVPFTFTNYAMGVTSIRTFTFWWASQLGLLPGCLLFVYAGTRLPTLRQLSTSKPGDVLTAGLFVVLIAIVLLPLGLRWVWQQLGERRQQSHSSD